MTNDLIKPDRSTGVLREDMNRRLDERVAQIDLYNAPGASVAPTFVVARRLGGVGASCASLTLEFLSRQPLLHIEVGGAPCPAFKNRGPDTYLHFASSDGAVIEQAMNARLHHASRPAVLEFEPALYKETLGIAVDLKRLVHPSIVTILYIAGTHDPYPKYEANAHNRGFRELYLCRQPTQSYHADPNGLIKLPWIDSEIVSRMMKSGISLAEALKQSDGLWSVNTTRVALTEFGTALSGADR